MISTDTSMHPATVAPTIRRAPGGAFRTVLCAVGSSGGLIAIDRAARLPLAPEAAVTAVKFAPPRSSWWQPRSSGPEANGGRTAELIRSRLARAHLDGRVVETAPDGKLVSCVMQQAKASQAELVVVAHERRSLSARLFGGLPEELVRTGRLPVLVVNRAPKGAYRKVVVAVDFSEASSAALSEAARIVRGTDARVQVLHVYDTSYSLVLHHATESAGDLTRYAESQRQQACEALERFLEPFESLLPGMERELVSGDPSGEVHQRAEDCGADLLVIGQHGFRNRAHALLGSTAEAVLRKARCDVLVTPPPSELH